MPFCSNCGNSLSETAKFCGECGQKTNPSAAPAASASSSSSSAPAQPASNPTSSSSSSASSFAHSSGSCGKCGKPVVGSELLLSCFHSRANASNAGAAIEAIEKVFHEECFTCHVCNQHISQLPTDIDVRSDILTLRASYCLVFCVNVCSCFLLQHV